jgi:hypothetical protein
VAGLGSLCWSALVAALAVGCGVSQVPRSEAPSSPKASAASHSGPKQRAGPSIDAPSRESEVLRAAIVASLTPAAPGAGRIVASEEAIEPIDALVRAESAEAPAAPEASSPSTARLPPESIRRVVQQSAARFRDCYRRSTRASRPGRVVVHFVIGLDGRVWRAEEESASFGDREARVCLVRGFFQLTFPKPGGQRVAVRYPLSFSRDHGAAAERLPAAQRAAEPPPPGFAEAMQAGRPLVQPLPSLEAPRTPHPGGSRESVCIAGDPLCDEL